MVFYITAVHVKSTKPGSFSANVDEAMALTQQQRELLRYRKTQKFQSSVTRPMAGSRVLCLDGGSVRGLIQIEVRHCNSTDLCSMIKIFVHIYV